MPRIIIQGFGPNHIPRTARRRAGMGYRRGFRSLTSECMRGRRCRMSFGTVSITLVAAHLSAWTNYEFESKLLKAIGCPAPEKIFEPNWFATRNFHGQWYTDSDLLEGYLHFRSNQTCDDYFKWMASQVPWYFHLAKIVPPIFIKLGMGAIAKKPGLGNP